MAAEENTTSTSVTAAPEVILDGAATPNSITPSPAESSSAPTETTEVKTEVAPVVEVQKEPETLLSTQADKPTEVKPEVKDSADKSTEVKPEDKSAEKKEEASQSDEAPLPSYELKLPDDIKLDQEGQLKFTNLLGEYEKKVVSDPAKVHEATQELAQKLVETHIAELKTLATNLKTELTKQSDESKAAQMETWKQEFLSDPVYGGNRKDTTINAAEKAIKTYGGTTEEQQEFRDALKSSGLINHKAMVRLLANVTQARPSPIPLKAEAPMPVQKGLLQKMYGTNSGRR